MRLFNFIAVLFITLFFAACESYNNPGSATDTPAESTLVQAVQAGNAKTVTLYLQKGESPDQLDEDDTPLIVIAAKAGHTPVVKLLIEAGADVNVTNRFGNSALILATLEGHNEIANLLKQAGAEEPQLN